MSEQPTRKANGETEPRLVFHYIKNQNFRVIHVDGAIGSLVPTGHIHMALFSERRPIPQQMAHKITPDGQVGDSIPSETVSKEGIIREIDVDAMMSLPAAIGLHAWLGKQIELFKNQVKPEMKT